MGYFYNTRSNLGLDEGSSNVQGRAPTASGSVFGAPPAHLRGTPSATTQDPSSSSVSNPYEESTVSSAHLRSVGGENTQASTSRAGWSAADGKRRAAGIPFNAWDANGRSHSQYHVPSSTTGLSNISQKTSVSPPIPPSGQAAASAASSNNSDAPRPPGKKDWARPVRKWRHQDI
jgi:hypothetical protein